MTAFDNTAPKRFRVKFREFFAVVLSFAIMAGTSACAPAGDASGGADSQKMRNIPSTELIKEIKAGWNLGNTLDATSGEGLNSELSWGNPKTTFEMIEEIKKAGFDAVRLPVSWGKHLGGAPDYEVDSAWMDRVEEVVGYVLDNGLYCILNTHHESWLFPDEENEAENTKQLTALWRQISARFADYNEKLIFEGMNEPRLHGTRYEWNGGTEESRMVVNRLNAAFVKTVRGSGGNNKLRHLMVTGYAASADKTGDGQWIFESLELPENDDKLIVSVHAYLPYSFALKMPGGAKWLLEKEGSTRSINELFDGIKEVFTDKGVAVIIGETGALNKDNLEARTNWAKYYFGKGREYGIPCFWWDNGLVSGGGELFGLFNRRELSWSFPEIKDAILGK
ncbi:MAG: glycoside hydrolase family 5 protein [Oscillospiraceae bacterium]|jgi:endoglucanase|nr:glycoside hydrolase family 5 protein [Oscillospiraceae bacterium]